MIVFDMLKIRCVIASLARFGNRFCVQIVELWNELSSEPAPNANLIRHSWCSDFFLAGQPRRIARNASWLNYRHGSNSHRRIAAWPAVGVPGEMAASRRHGVARSFVRFAECRS